MAKSKLTQRKTNIQSPDGVGTELEQTLNIDDCSLPSPEELRCYQEVDPNIVKFLMDTSSKEQAHRHELDHKQVSLIDKNNRYRYNINRIGLYSALVIMIFSLFFSGFLIYFEKPIEGTIFGSIALISIAAIFIPRSSRK